MQRKRHTPEQRDEALQLVAEHGQAEAARRTGIAIGTIASWASRHNVTSPPVEHMEKLVAGRVVNVADRKARLAEDLLDDITRLRARLFAPHTERKAMVVSDGRDAGSHIEIAEIPLEQLSPGDQKLLMTAVAIAVDKVQILTGEATERIEQLTGETSVADRAARARQVRDELAERRRTA